MCSFSAKDRDEEWSPLHPVVAKFYDIEATRLVV